MTLETVDAMRIGAGAHREYLSYWQSALTSPTTTPNERKFAEIAARTPHFVLSRTLRTVEWPNASVLAGGVEGIASLKSRMAASSSCGADRRSPRRPSRPSSSTSTTSSRIRSSWDAARSSLPTSPPRTACDI